MADGNSTTDGTKSNAETQPSDGKTKKNNGHPALDTDALAELGVVIDPPEDPPPPPPGQYWPDPEPLEPPLGEEEPYPLDALPPVLADAIAEYQPFGQQPVPLIAGSALGMASLAAQPFADAARDSLLCGPIGLYMMAIGVSGERKTAADRVFTRAAMRWLHEHRLQRAKNDRELFLVYQDVTPEKLATGLFERWPSAGQFTDEAATLIGSHAVTETALRYFGLLNRLWDGSSFSRERQTGGSVNLVGRRFTVNMMMQPAVLAQLLALNDGLARAVGWFGRFLIAWPRSTLGTHVYREPPVRTPALDRYERRIVELLDAQLSDRFPLVPGDPTAALAPPTVTLDRRAKECWREHHDQVARELGEWGKYAEFVDVAAKNAENVVRLAANFHLLEGGEAPGELGAEIMESTVRLGCWYLGETRRALGIGQAAPVNMDATLLSAWASRRVVSSFPAREVSRSGPPRLRQLPARRDAALDLLCQAHHLRPIHRHGGVRYHVNPKLINRSERR
jgi:hypothetical protein